MRSGISFFLIVALLVLVPSASATHVSISNIILDSGGTATADVNLDSIDQDNGLAGYSFNLTIANPSLARVSAVTYNPALGGLTTTTTLPFTDGHIAWVDTGHTIEPHGTAINIRLATITIQGLSGGSTTLGTTFSAFDGDGPNWADLRESSSIASPVITVAGQISAALKPVALPSSVLPGDPDSDGFYEDLNNDGLITFDDVNLFFTNYDWINGNEPVSLFDFNSNGKIDFSDIIILNLKRMQ